MEEHIIGTGVFAWHRGERITDRYGAVYLEKDAESEESAPLNVEGIVDKFGGLHARILETRPSFHIGDFFRGFAPPKTPLPVGTTLFLGIGTFFIENDGEGMVVGVYPQDNRKTDWLDPRELYKLHNQTVELFFCEIERHFF